MSIDGGPTGRLAGRVVLVTGAARGIGAHTARLAAARGARLSLVGLEPDRLAALGGIDAVVANAGVANRGTIAVGDVEALVHTVQVNLVGVMRTAAATVPALIDRGGYLLIVSSAAAFAALPGMAAYCASKAGVEHFGTAIRLELAHRGVAVGTAHPSWVDTDLVRESRADLPAFDAALAKLPWPMRRTTTVAECAKAFVRAIERRSRRVYVPRAVGAVQAVRSLLVSPLADRLVGRTARVTVPSIEEQARALGRGFGVSTPQVRP